jgi:serine/threonine protein kinase
MKRQTPKFVFGEAGLPVRKELRAVMSDEFETLFAGPEVVDQVLNDFQDCWRRNEPPSLTGFLRRIQDQPGSVRETLRVRLIQLDQAVRWQLWRKQTDALVRTVEGAGKRTDRSVSRQPPLLEDYARNCPEIGPVDSLPLELVVHEFQLRVECRDDPKVEEYERRFPQFASTLSTAILTMLVDSDTAKIGPDGITLSEPAYLKRTSTKTSSNTQTEPMQPSEMPQPPRREVRRVQAERQFGQYELLYELARGGMGVVYKARDVEIDRPVALKMILAGKLASPRDIQLFQDEAKSAGNLKHENIVPIYGAGEIRGKHFIAMAFIEGQSLLDLVREKPLAPRRAAEIVELVARALHYAHTQPKPVFHRDIKPANILMDSSGKPYVTDFGIAKRVEGKDTNATLVNLPLGTPCYMPLEQAKCLMAEIGPWSDVYSTGAVLYHLLTGKPPFLADTVTETLRQVEQEDVVSPRQLNHQVNADLEAVCLMCLEKDWRNRYQSAQELADDLRRFLNHEPTKARPLSAIGRLARWCRRNPAVAALTMTTALLLIAISIGASIAYFRMKDLADRESGLKIEAQEERDKKKKALDDATSAKDEADRLKKIADAEKAKADLQRAKAEKSASDAIKEQIKAKEQERLADARKRDAEAKEMEADEQRNIAYAKKLEADRKATEAVNARNEAQQNLQRAINTVDQLLTFTADEGLKDLPGGERIRKGLAQEALRQLDPLLKANPKDQQAQLALAKIKHVQARLEAITAPGAEVDSIFEESIGLYQNLLNENPQQMEVLIGLAAAYRSYGDSLTDRSQRDGAQKFELLNRALTQFGFGTDLSGKISDPVAANDLKLNFDFELARTYLSRSICLKYQKKNEDGIRDAKAASKQFEELVNHVPDEERRNRVKRHWASNLRNIVNLESQQNTKPDITQLNTWLEQLERAKESQKQLLQRNRDSIDLMHDLALTKFTQAYLLIREARLYEMVTPKKYDEGLAEFEEAKKTFSYLVVRFEEIPKYELHRIFTLELSAIVLADKAKLLEAAQVLMEAEIAIRKYNDKNSAVKQEDVQLRIADFAADISEDLLIMGDRTNAAKITAWALPSARALRSEAEDLGLRANAAALENKIKAIDMRIRASSGSSK